jgi:dephospho-CoA kinase
MKRNEITRDEVLLRMKNQWSDEEKMKLANFIIVNDNVQAVLPRVWNVLEKLNMNQ